MNILDHSGHSRGFPSKLFKFSFGRLLLPAYPLLYRSRPALGETSPSSTLKDQSRELRYLAKRLVLFTSVVTWKQAVDRSGVRRRRLSILLAHCETSHFFGVQLKVDLSRASVDWERASSSFSNAVLITLSSCSRSSSIS